MRRIEFESPGINYFKELSKISRKHGKNHGNYRQNIELGDQFLLYSFLQIVSFALTLTIRRRVGAPPKGVIHRPRGRFFRHFWPPSPFVDHFTKNGLCKVCFFNNVLDKRGWSKNSHDPALIFQANTHSHPNIGLDRANFWINPFCQVRLKKQTLVIWTFG